MRFMQTESVLQTKNRSGPAKNRFSVALTDRDVCQGTGHGQSLTHSLRTGIYDLKFVLPNTVLLTAETKEDSKAELGWMLKVT